MSLIHAAGLFLLFLVLLALELFIPSGGLLGIAAAAALMGAIIIGFIHSLAAGALILVGSAIVVPVFVSAGLRIWPKTAIGRRMLTLDPEADEIREEESRAEREAIIGKTGVAKTNLLPNGMIEIDGVRMDAVSTGGAIDAGTSIEVFSLIGGKIRVRPYLGESKGAKPTMPPSLETPIESLGIED